MAFGLVSAWAELYLAAARKSKRKYPAPNSDWHGECKTVYIGALRMAVATVLFGDRGYVFLRKRGA
jgi:hypothetical protein